MGGRQRVEAAAGEPPDLAVAQCRDAARALAVGQQRHLADDVTRRDLGDQDRLVEDLLLVAEHAEAAARHQVDRVGGLALVEQRCAARQDKQRQLALDRRHACRVEVGEQRRTLQRLAKTQPGRFLGRRDVAHPPLLIGRAFP